MKSAITGVITKFLAILLMAYIFIFSPVTALAQTKQPITKNVLQPDLKVTDVSTGQTTVRYPATINVTVKNIGNADATKLGGNAIITMAYLYGPSGKLVNACSDYFYLLKPGQSRLWQGQCGTYQTAGTYKIVVTTDANNIVKESDKSNNSFTTSINVLNKIPLKSVSISHSPQNPTTNDTITYVAKFSYISGISKIEMVANGNNLKPNCFLTTTGITCIATNKYSKPQYVAWGVDALDKNGRYLPDSAQLETFTVKDAPKPVTLSVSPATIPVGGKMSFTWSGVQNPAIGDYIFVYNAKGVRQDSPRFWTNNCFKLSSDAPKASGTCTDMPVPSFPGTYYMVLYSNINNKVLATSNAFNVVATLPIINSVTIAKCGSTSCGTITTVIINGSYFEDNIKVEAVGSDGKHYGQDTFSAPNIPYAIIVGKTGNTQLIVDFHGLPCNQTYSVRVYYPTPDARSATQTGTFVPHNTCFAPKG